MPAFLRRHEGVELLVLANFSATPIPDYRVGVPRAGRWRVRFNSDWDGYDPEFETSFQGLIAKLDPSAAAD